MEKSSSSSRCSNASLRACFDSRPPRRLLLSAAACSIRSLHASHCYIADGLEVGKERERKKRSIEGVS